MDCFTERAISFGRQNHLVGVLNDPPGRDKDAPVVVLLTAGLVSSAGPFRMYVSIARRLQSLGFASFRIDLSGVGESMIPSTEADIRTRVEQDITDALDYLENKIGAKSFVVGGLCSGADDAHMIATRDRRVAGVILLDGYAYKSRYRKIKGTLVKMLNPIRVTRWASRKLATLLWGNGQNAIGAAAGYARSFPTLEHFRSEVQANVNAGIRYLCVFSGGVSLYYEAEGQFLEGLGLTHLTSMIEEVYLPECDHTYALYHDRSKLCDNIQRWISRWDSPRERPEPGVR